MKWQRPLIIILAVVFFLTALTIYLNRVVLPVQAKKLITIQAESFLKRKVEFEALHFNWVKGFIVENLKIYQKGSDTNVFLQTERLTCGIIFIPGIKQHKLTIPFINIERPSVHLIRQSAQEWNFSDLAQNPPPAQGEQAPPVSVALAGVNIIDGKIRIDDLANGGQWTELLDHVNLKVSLSYKGITFDTSADLPAKHGSLSAVGHFQPLDQSLHADVRVNNIRPAEYFNFLPPIEGLTWKAGTVDKVQISIDHSKDSMAMRGDIAFKGLDADYKGQRLKADIALKNTDLVYKNGPFTAKGQITFAGSAWISETQNIKGQLNLDIKEAVMDAQSILFNGDLMAKSLDATLAAGQTVQGDITLQDMKIRKDKDGTQIVGAVLTKNLNAHINSQAVRGDFTLKPLTVQIKDTHHIDVATDIKAGNAAIILDEKKSWKGNAALNDVAVNLNNNILSIKTHGALTDSVFVLDTEQTAAISPSFTLDASVPLNNPQEATYSGHVNIKDAEVTGFPFSPFKNINFDADIKTDTLAIKELTLKVLDTNVKAAGTVMNFKSPVLNIEAESEKIDLAKIKDVAPQIIKEYGLEISGSSSFKAHFEGLVSDLAGAKIKATAGLQNVNIKSSKFNQAASEISGTVECTPNSLTWNNFTGIYLGKAYTLNGSLNDFKNPVVKTTLDGADVQLKADLRKKDDRLTVNELTGKYLTLLFGVTGSIDLPAQAQPVLDINAKVTSSLEDLLVFLPEEQKKLIEGFKPSGPITANAAIKGKLPDWKNWTTKATIQSAAFSIMGYKASDLNIVIDQHDGKIGNMTADAIVYEGKLHAVGSGELDEGMPFDLALNVDALNLHKLKADIPALQTEEIQGKFYMTAVSKGSLTDIKNLEAKGSLAIREGFLTEFKIFKGLLGVLNQALKIGQVMITDVESNFTVKEQKIDISNLRLISPTIVLAGQGWVNFDQYCDFNLQVDMTSGIVPPIAQDVLRTLSVHIYDKIANPKFNHKISVPQVINTLIKTIGIFQ